MKATTQPDSTDAADSVVATTQPESTDAADSDSDGSVGALRGLLLSEAESDGSFSCVGLFAADGEDDEDGHLPPLGSDGEDDEDGSLKRTIYTTLN